MHPLYADPSERAALMSLLDATWPGLAARFDAAARLGWPVGEHSTPFVTREGGRLASHVGVLDLPVMLGGRERRIAGLHGVCTLPEARRRGHARAALAQAMEHVAAHFGAAKLQTDKPWLYGPFGFRVVPQHRFRLNRRGRAGPGSAPVGAEDLPWLRQVLATRAPLSRRFAARDDGWLVGIDTVLRRGDLSLLHRVAHLDCAVAWELRGRTLLLDQVIAPRLPLLVELLAAAPWDFDAVEFRFSPDRLAPEALPQPETGEDALMVWGDWPALPPFAVPPLEQH
ncbi:MAG: GNAT family N-acetyltransferase [Pseudomonadota bacterium]